MPTPEEIVAISERAAEGPLALPGVLLVGMGVKYTGDQPTGVPAIQVYVERKRPVTELAPHEVVPPSIEGVPTDVVQIGRIHPHAPSAPLGVLDPDRLPYDPTRTDFLIGGYRIGPVDAGYFGTIGCVVADLDHADRFYVLTNHHVVSGEGAFTPTPNSSLVGQPTGVKSWTCCDDTFGVFAAGTRVPPTDLPDRDEALVRINPGRTWAAQIHELGIITGTHPLSLDEINQKTFPVRKRGARTGVTGGVVLGYAVKVGDPTYTKLLTVKPNPQNPPAGQKYYFTDHGDSGSAVVDDLGQKDADGNETAINVVGLLWGGSDEGYGLVLPIQDVLGRFAKDTPPINLEVATFGKYSGVQTVPMTAIAQPQFQGADDPALTKLATDAEQSEAGRLLSALWQQHSEELVGLVRGNRRVQLSWHRSGAAGVFQLLGRMLKEPELELPERINGQPIDNGVDDLHRVLREQAGPQLRTALDRAHGALPNLAGLTYAGIVDALGRV